MPLKTVRIKNKDSRNAPIAFMRERLVRPFNLAVNHVGVRATSRFIELLVSDSVELSFDVLGILRNLSVVALFNGMRGLCNAVCAVRKFLDLESET